MFPDLKSNSGSLEKFIEFIEESMVQNKLVLIKPDGQVYVGSAEEIGRVLLLDYATFVQTPVELAKHKLKIPL